MRKQYRAPGGVTDLRHANLKEAWNRAIIQAWEDVAGDFPTSAAARRHVSPTPLSGRHAPVLWSPVPRQLVSCLGRSRAMRLCDTAFVAKSPTTSFRSGREWHREYCEYHVVLQSDRHHRTRPKRVEITTELREYWLMLAENDPNVLLKVARQVLDNQSVSFEQLYGHTNPGALSPSERNTRFVEQTAGSAIGDPRVVPRGPLNREHALFMCHPINGLDDFFFTTTFGAQPYYRMLHGAATTAPLPWIFLDSHLLRDAPEDLAAMRDTYCRNSDPAASFIAYQVALGGGQLALADPPGVYMRKEDFDLTALVYADDPIPTDWVRWSRPEVGPRHQRLVLGPPDDMPDVFLDDIRVHRGRESVPLRGGYQLLELLSVGPDLVVKAAHLPMPADRHLMNLQPLVESIPCGSSGSRICKELASWATLISEKAVAPSSSVVSEIDGPSR